jgi:anaerobic magnesium-protoporphyrin IX monomethyl ester cyclase
MRALFFYTEQDPFMPDKPLEVQERVQFGISYISAVLQQAGHVTDLVVLTRENLRRMDQWVEEFRPDLACFTSVYSEHLFVAEAARRLKKRHPGVFTLLGGPHPSLNPEECLAGGFDAVCVGEGEYPTLELLGQLEEGRVPSGIPNLWFRRNGGLERNPTRPFIPDLDSLPFPDRRMWDRWVAHPAYRPSVLVGRGCPFQCTYCCNHALRRLAPGRYVRLRSPGSVVAEIEEFSRTYPEAAQFYLEVETLGTDTDWALSLCDALADMNRRRDRPLEFGTNLRVTPRRDYDGLFEAMRRANFSFINIGLESGSEELRREVLKRRYSNQDIERAVAAARSHGLKVGIYNLIGIPGETVEDFRRTVEVNRACQPDHFLLSVFFPYPGSDLYEKAKRDGLLEKMPDAALERRRPVLDQPGLSKRQVRRRLLWFAWSVYRGNKPLGAILYVTVLARIASSPRLLRIWRKRQERLFRKEKEGVAAAE